MYLFEARFNLKIDYIDDDQNWKLIELILI